jgi:hypothetical protein
MTLSTWRKILMVVYGIGLLFSLMIALGSVFIFDGTDFMWIRISVFLSAMALPVTILLSMFLSKDSLKWFLLPLLPLATFFIFNSLFDKARADSDRIFCEQAIANNDRSILDNLSGNPCAQYMPVAPTK